MATTNLGRVAIVPKGVYDVGTTYEKLDLVTGVGCSYMYINPTPAAGVPLTNTSHWQQIASMGGQDLVDAAVAARDAAQGYKDAAANSAAQLQAGIGSPAGSYDDLAALNTANPAHDRTYLTKNDWKLAYYDAIAEVFVAGGVYQTLQGVDDTLTQTGYAADAKITGDRFDGIYMLEKTGGNILQIYPVPNSPLTIVVEGTYMQESSDNSPSPDNIVTLTPWLGANESINIAITDGDDVDITAPVMIPDGWMDNLGNGEANWLGHICTGSENWQTGSATTGDKYYKWDAGFNTFATQYSVLCSHYPYNIISGSTTLIGISGNSTLNGIRIRPNLTTYPDVTSFKAYLAEQFAAGTPVVFFFKLATPATITPVVAPLSTLPQIDPTVPRLNVLTVSMGDIELTYAKSMSSLGESVDIGVAAATELVGAHTENAPTIGARFDNQYEEITFLKRIIKSPNEQIISISGTGSVETDYILPLNVHRGSPLGDVAGTDIFLNNECKTDFSDLSFSDANGNELKHYIHSHGNYEIIYDNNRVGGSNRVYNGVIYASYVPGQAAGVYKSADNGATWSQIFPVNHDLVFIDSRGYIYIVGSGHLRRSTDSGATWGSVLDMTDSGSYVRFTGMAEDSLGYLHVGKYQEEYDAAMYRSTDGGATFTKVWDNENVQHVHGVYVDPYTDYIYAGLDGLTGNIRMIRSTNNGASYSDLWINDNAAMCTMFATETYRIFGGGAYGPIMGNSLYRTEDDETFTTILQTSSSVQTMERLGDHLYMGAVTYATNAYTTIYRSNLDGTGIETIWQGPNDTNLSFHGILKIAKASTPAGATEEHLLAGSTSNYSNARIFDGGDHYQSLIYLKIPSLPADGMDISVYSGNASAVSASKVTLFPQQGVELPTPLLHIPLNEGSGLTAYDISGNGMHGSIIHVDAKGGWNEATIRRAGPAYPFIPVGSGSYSFNGGDCIEIPTDSTLDPINKNFSAVAWINASEPANALRIVGQGSQNSKWSLQESSLGALSFAYGNGTTAKSITMSPGRVIVGYPRMVGIVVDDSTPAKIRFIVDGVFSKSYDLEFDILTNSGYLIRIGAELPGYKAFVGDISDVRIYPYQLTQLQVTQLYENRLLAATEPAAST